MKDRGKTTTTADLALSRSLVLDHLERHIGQVYQRCGECPRLADEYADVAFEVGVSCEMAAKR